MKKSEAKSLALGLMERHGLDDWDFKFDNAKRRFGKCSYGKHTISLSSELTKLNSVKTVTDTILHEIAHALVGPGHNHGPVWRRKTEEIGAEPDSGKAGIPVPGKYQLECPSCGEIYHFHRQVMKRKACGRCCNMHSNGKFSNQFELKEVDMKEKPVFIKSRNHTGRAQES